MYWVCFKSGEDRLGRGRIGMLWGDLGLGFRGFGVYGGWSEIVG